jgi:kinetochore protein Mis13/DSN1
MFNAGFDEPLRNRAQEEDEEWKRVRYFYDGQKKKMQAELEERRARADPPTQSSKAKGKRKATGDRVMGSDEDWNPREHELGADFRAGVGLAKAVLGMRSMGEERVVGPAAARVGLGSGEKEAEVNRLLQGVEFKLDQLHTFTNTARKATNIAERDLDRRFDLLSRALDARSNPPSSDLALSSAHILSTYIPRAGSGETDPQELMRALAKIDSERPPAKVGDAARRAAREVQRAEESRIGAVGDRRLTGVPLVGGIQTPRKTPGTPKRGSTSGREREGR